MDGLHNACREKEDSLCQADIGKLRLGRPSDLMYRVCHFARLETMDSLLSQAVMVRLSLEKSHLLPAVRKSANKKPSKGLNVELQRNRSIKSSKPKPHCLVTSPIRPLSCVLESFAFIPISVLQPHVAQSFYDPTGT